MCKPSNTFTLKMYLFGTVELVRNAIRSKLIYNGQGIAFDGEGLWSFGNDFARNVAILMLIIFHDLILIIKK